MSWFTIAEFRQYMPDMASEGLYPDERITLVQNMVERQIERLTGTYFVSTTVTDTVSGTNDYSVNLSQFFVQSITSVTENGTLTSGYTYTFRGGVLRRYSSGATYPTPWWIGYDNITIVYQAGYSATCPDDLKLAAMRATRDGVLSISPNSGRNSRATQLNSDAGSMQFSLTGPDRPFGIPDVDVVVMGYVEQCQFGLS